MTRPPRTLGFRVQSGLISVGLLAGFALVGCAPPEPAWREPDESIVFGTAREGAKKPLPEYAAVAAAYNKRLIGCDRIVARANIRLVYFDKQGERQVENPEGTLQIVTEDPFRPKLALSLGKAGQTLFWFGCDAERYWWLDLSDKNDRVGGVGRLALFDRPAVANGVAKQRLGLDIKPTDLIRLLGVIPLDQTGPAKLQWSRDGALLGIVTRLEGARGGGSQRLWVEPATLIPRTIELYNRTGRLVLVGEHEGLENVQITRTGIPELIGARPRVPARVQCFHADSGSDIRLTLSGAKDGPISDKAFSLDELKRRLNVDRVIDFDR
ncbi:MAG: hypothetical protein ACK4WH_15055 [Phycisphaerales bacterium]